MPAKPRKSPAYRLHKPTGQAVVRLNGKDYYLGNHGTPASQEKYGRLIGEWWGRGQTAERATPGSLTEGGGPVVTINAVILEFWTRHAETHYRHTDGTPTGELANFRESVKLLKSLYGTTPAERFSPKSLKAVRQAMIDAGLSRGVINQRVGRIVHLIKWAASEELVTPSVHHGLATVSGLQKGRTAARETEPVKPVADCLVDAIRPLVSRQVWAMVELQRLTGMRPGEVVMIRGCDVGTSGITWVYIPNRHKTSHHGKARPIYLGPKAQAVLKPWLKEDASSFLFSPREAMAERRARLRCDRKTPMTPSQRSRKPKRSPKRTPSGRYSARTYYHAIRNACLKGGITPWHPNQLRHTAGTNIRRAFGLDATRAVLGHSDMKVTEVYAERDSGLAAEAMRQIG